MQIYLDMCKPTVSWFRGFLHFYNWANLWLPIMMESTVLTIHTMVMTITLTVWAEAVDSCGQPFCQSNMGKEWALMINMHSLLVEVHVRSRKLSLPNCVLKVMGITNYIHEKLALWFEGFHKCRKTSSDQDFNCLKSWNWGLFYNVI